VSSVTTGLPALTSGGATVVYAVDALAGTLTGYVDADSDGALGAGDVTVFIFTVGSDGRWSFDLEGQLDHEAGGSENDLLLDLSTAIQVTDFDGDTATAAAGTFVITVDDDMP